MTSYDDENRGILKLTMRESSTAAPIAFVITLEKTRRSIRCKQMGKQDTCMRTRATRILQRRHQTDQHYTRQRQNTHRYPKHRSVNLVHVRQTQDTQSNSQRFNVCTRGYRLRHLTTETLTGTIHTLFGTSVNTKRGGTTPQRTHTFN